jgi:DNA-binding response OmpR family regulator
MPARIVLVHDDLAFSNALRERLSPNVDWYADPTIALTALEAAKTLTFLVTRLQFGDRQPIGLSLARLARTARPDVRVIFTGLTEHKDLALGLGEFIPEPVQAPHVAMLIEWLTEREGAAL